jgi:hypothetical protein
MRWIIETHAASIRGGLASRRSNEEQNHGSIHFFRESGGSFLNSCIILNYTLLYC